MDPASDHDGNSEQRTSDLEDEVAAWRSRRGLRQGTTVGRVQVVRIAKRRVRAPCCPRLNHDARWNS